VSRTILIECSPRQPSDGAVVPVRLVFNAVSRANFLGVQWHPAVVSVPAFEASLGFDGRQFGAAPSPQIGDLVFALTVGTRFAASLVWTNAAITIRAGDWTAAGGDPADGALATIWTGQAEDIATGGAQARVRLLDNGQALRVPALAAKFGSTGDALLDGADALKDRSAETRVPRAWGKLLSIPSLLVDRANNIWLFAGNAATSVQAFYDGGAAFTLGVARASLAALQANAPAAGTVDYCLDAGGKFLARPWTPPIYPFTAAATFGTTTAASIASAIVTGRTAVTFTSGTVTAFNALQGAECGLYLDDDTSVAAALDRLFSGLGAWWRLSSAGTITLGRWAWGTPALTIPAHRRHAPERLRVLAPTRRRSLGYARNDRVHSEAEIARIITDAAYSDGTSIDSLRPATVGATRNIVTYSMAAPSSPVDNDLWVDLSGTFAVFKLRSGGAWVTGANALTAYNALSGTPVALADINTTESSKLAGIESGADVTALAVPSLSVQPLVTVNYDYTGAPVSGALPATLRAIRKRGDTDVSASTTWSLAGSGFTASIASDGAITVIAVDSSTTMTVISTRDSVTLSQNVSIKKETAAPPSGGSGGGTAATDSSIGSIASNSWGAPIAGPMTVRTGSTGQISLSAPLTITRAATAPAGTFGVRLKWQWQVVGGSYADSPAGEVSETTALVVTDEGGGFYTVEDGAVIANDTVTSLLANTDYEVQLLGRTSSGSTSRGMIGTASAVGS
jgi:hypothetical protein